MFNPDDLIARFARESARKGRVFRLSQAVTDYINERIDRELIQQSGKVKGSRRRAEPAV